MPDDLIEIELKAGHGTAATGIWASSFGVMLAIAAAGTVAVASESWVFASVLGCCVLAGCLVLTIGVSKPDSIVVSPGDDHFIHVRHGLFGRLEERCRKDEFAHITVHEYRMEDSAFVSDDNKQIYLVPRDGGVRTLLFRSFDYDLVDEMAEKLSGSLGLEVKIERGM